jgi:nucleoside triphosphatase
MKKDYSQGIEVVVTSLIVNDDKKILLIESYKWKDVYLMPGGHVKKGEKIIDAVKREGEEETGLKLKPLYCINAGELINDPIYHRKAHFIYFYFICKALTSKIKLEKKELKKYIWVDPSKALHLKLAVGVKKAIKSYINEIKINIATKKFK